MLGHFFELAGYLMILLNLLLILKNAKKNREHSEIIYDILISIREKEGINKTNPYLIQIKIFRKQMMEEYLNELISKMD